MVFHLETATLISVINVPIVATTTTVMMTTTTTGRDLLLSSSLKTTIQAVAMAAMYAATSRMSMMATPLMVSSSTNTKSTHPMRVRIVAFRLRAAFITFPFTRATFVDGIVNKSLYHLYHTCVKKSTLGGV